MTRARTLLIPLSFLALAFLLTVDRRVAAHGGGRGQFGKELDTLSMEERRVFRDAKAEFEEEEEAQEGLGPIFNHVSCVACHSIPVTGGSSPILETRAQKLLDGVLFEFPGGSLFQVSAIRPECAEVVPVDANVRALRQTTPLFGAGLIEAIPDAQLEAYAALQARVSPGQAGRMHRIVDVASGAVRIGRFGWKAQQATLLAFSGDAYVNEMGITNRLFPFENAPNGNLVQLAQCDPVADPEDANEDFVAFADYMRFLAPPPRSDQWERNDNAGGHGGPAQLQRGRAALESVGCAVCHRSGFTTSSRTAALDRQRVDAFSDFLLHDVGTGDGIVQGDAQGNEFRTSPLWGIAESGPYLHDGSAPTIEAAIERHGNQAAVAREAFGHLSAADKEALLAFPDSI